MNNMKYITINKNRGWRGLAEIRLLDEDCKQLFKYIFSFSQKIWEDLITKNIAVIENGGYYYVIHFSTTIRGLLPRPYQQRSVLIKNYSAEIDKVYKVPVSEWHKETSEVWQPINNFIKNKNNHTTSDWNCIGIRVIPEI